MSFREDNSKKHILELLPKYFLDIPIYIPHYLNQIKSGICGRLPPLGLCLSMHHQVLSFSFFWRHINHNLLHYPSHRKAQQANPCKRGKSHMPCENQNESIIQTETGLISGLSDLLLYTKRYAFRIKELRNCVPNSSREDPLGLLLLLFQWVYLGE